VRTSIPGGKIAGLYRVPWGERRQHQRHHSEQRIGDIAKQLKAFREGTRKNPLMNAVAGQLTDTDIDNVAAFFNSLSASGENEPPDTAKLLGENRVTLPSNFREIFTRYSISDQAGPERVRYNFLNESAVGGLDSKGWDDAIPPDRRP
jgi:hypothetical protein